MSDDLSSSPNARSSVVTTVDAHGALNQNPLNDAHAIGAVNHKGVRRTTEDGHSYAVDLAGTDAQTRDRKLKHKDADGVPRRKLPKPDEPEDLKRLAMEIKKDHGSSKNAAGDDRTALRKARPY